MPGGKTTLYNPEMLNQVKDWAMSGLTAVDIAHNLGIHVAILCEWKRQHPELNDVLNAGKETTDYRVENALYIRAVGFEYDEVEVRNGQEYKRVRKQALPDVTAQIVLA